MHIDPKSSVPIYRQIVSGVQTAIASGIYKPGECLPSLRAMALELGVNPNTVQRAYDALEREGTLESRRGVGVFVTDGAATSARSAKERRVSKALKKVIRDAFREDISIDRLRSLFESALSSSRGHLGRRQND